MSQAVVKRAIRKDLLTKRKELFKNCDCTASAPKMFNLIASMIKPELREELVLAGYFPVNNEFNIIPLLSYFNKESWAVALPVIHKNSRQLRFHHWNNLNPGDLINSRYNIPIPNPMISLQLYPSILLVPVVGFTNTCARLGYGGGYYDSTISELKTMNKLKLAIGVAYEGQICDSIPQEDKDQMLDAVITEKFLYFKDYSIGL